MSSTPTTKPDGKPRPPDDKQPRVQLRKAVANHTLSISNENSIEEFSKEYIVDKQLVVDALQKLQATDMRKKKRAADKKKATEKEKNLKFEEVDWKGLMEAGHLLKKSYKMFG